MADEFSIDFSSLHCAVTDVLAALERVAEALRLPLDEMPLVRVCVGVHVHMDVCVSVCVCASSVAEVPLVGGWVHVFRFICMVVVGGG